MKFDDLTLGVLVLLGSIGILYSSTYFSPLPGQAYGADTMPRTIGLCGLMLGLFLTIGAVRAGHRVPHVSRSEWTRTPRALAVFVLTLALIAAYIVLADSVGFIPIAVAILVVLMLVLGVHPLTAIAVSIVAAFVIQFAFGRLLLVPLPRSPLFG